MYVLLHICCSTPSAPVYLLLTSCISVVPPPVVSKPALMSIVAHVLCGLLVSSLTRVQTEKEIATNDALVILDDLDGFLSESTTSNSYLTNAFDAKLKADPSSSTLHDQHKTPATNTTIPPTVFTPDTNTMTSATKADVDAALGLVDVDASSSMAKELAATSHEVVIKPSAPALKAAPKAVPASKAAPAQETPRRRKLVRGGNAKKTPVLAEYTNALAALVDLDSFLNKYEEMFSEILNFEGPSTPNNSNKSSKNLFNRSSRKGSHVFTTESETMATKFTHQGAPIVIGRYAARRFLTSLVHDTLTSTTCSEEPSSSRAWCAISALDRHFCLHVLIGALIGLCRLWCVCRRAVQCHFPRKSRGRIAWQGARL